MAAPRKLFLTHAAELAHHLVRAIARDAMVAEFVRRYAARHDRHKVVANAERLREMETTISREALLLIAAEVRRLLPRAFGLSRDSRSEDLALCDVFFTEFLEALSRALQWPLADGGAEIQAFRRDLEMYARWGERNPELPRASKRSADDSPFPDRCAILLDSAMMEQARRAAAEFQVDLLRLGTRIFAQLGRRGPERRQQSATRVPSTNNRGQKGAAREGNKGVPSSGKPDPRRRRG
jgi:hypothetical protein